ncbi:hypothetical protein A2331_05855 [Candidatus Falkowbacteria bacterium RIFOXYB2_FULL_34_18]|uniref:Ribosomal RNA large subunit methyltransferase H n=1 Tax=Candidatus Falkowbacteria bacterium RIFOXYD2_FULL_34_120 TaxID=1798007 RepID=A0A1F5TM51_9BACT|nr:MAG: hypothetical protein A2331_05855 [Candidatus Falkowbacteria bacterium RIFOXYB2_FULL_34_18]OGF29242.1 MAG: hypothetical protein A2500_05800 [Candidatus Falkowbacteria bacterium RIFOXYC12_FULL_34_55]OGF36984.1 MAG: hypothetical protein A2466_07180 [Candidatus Falkowbacteria bacterium RIFOXYC2_FULL_34_220]OGF38764.1 MAG: hypothetical protein A2515_01465 [Candidatus Falkowbacteria bacterium RIFOXYD12_FULL_34_57]OGF39998.1 MAG: hypothetical protein A2531_01720 [Candidatus Falkowbacteria bact
MDITILAIGKIKERYFQDAYCEFLKRLNPYIKINIQELAHKSFFNNDQEKIKKEEGKKIIKYLDKYSQKKIIVLDERGDNMTSEKFSVFLFKIKEPIIFVLGGSLGLSKEVLSRADYKIALSQMTFPHELARVVLVEQIYRAITIEKGKNYHL